MDELPGCMCRLILRIFEVLAWRQGAGFFADRTVAQHTRKAMENRNTNVVRVVTVWVRSLAVTS